VFCIFQLIYLFTWLIFVYGAIAVSFNHVFFTFCIDKENLEIDSRKIQTESKLSCHHLELDPNLLQNKKKKPKIVRNIKIFAQYKNEASTSKSSSRKFASSSFDFRIHPATTGSSDSNDQTQSTSINKIPATRVGDLICFEPTSRVEDVPMYQSFVKHSLDRLRQANSLSQL
jgi:hypothetical protein